MGAEAIKSFASKGDAVSDTFASLTPSSETLQEGLIRPVEAQDARKLLLSALEGNGAAGQALAHPNGFLKIPLPSLEPGQRLYLHLWSRHSSDSHIHNHRWSFASTVLFGALTNDLFVEMAVDDPEPPTWAGPVSSARYVPAGETFVIKPDGNSVTRVQRVGRAVHIAGTSYSQKAAELHRATVDNDTATLINRGPHLGHSARVLLHGKSASGVSQQFDLLSELDRRRALQGVLERLQP